MPNGLAQKEGRETPANAQESLQAKLDSLSREIERLKPHMSNEEYDSYKKKIDASLKLLKAGGDPSKQIGEIEGFLGRLQWMPNLLVEDRVALESLKTDILATVRDLSDAGIGDLERIDKIRNSLDDLLSKYLHKAGDSAKKTGEKGSVDSAWNDLLSEIRKDSEKNRTDPSLINYIFGTQAQPGSRDSIDSQILNYEKAIRNLYQFDSDTKDLFFSRKYAQNPQEEDSAEYAGKSNSEANAGIIKHSSNFGSEQMDLVLRRVYGKNGEGLAELAEKTGWHLSEQEKQYLSTGKISSAYYSLVGRISSDENMRQQFYNDISLLLGRHPESILNAILSKTEIKLSAEAGVELGAGSIFRENFDVLSLALLPGFFRDAPRFSGISQENMLFFVDSLDRLEPKTQYIPLSNPGAFEKMMSNTQTQAEALQVILQLLGMQNNLYADSPGYTSYSNASYFLKAITSESFSGTFFSHTLSTYLSRFDKTFRFNSIGQQRPDAYLPVIGGATFYGPPLRINPGVSQFGGIYDVESIESLGITTDLNSAIQSARAFTFMPPAALAQIRWFTPENLAFRIGSADLQDKISDIYFDIKKRFSSPRILSFGGQAAYSPTLFSDWWRAAAGLDLTQRGSRSSARGFLEDKPVYDDADEGIKGREKTTRISQNSNNFNAWGKAFGNSALDYALTKRRVLGFDDMDAKFNTNQNILLGQDAKLMIVGQANRSEHTKTTLFADAVETRRKLVNFFGMTQQEAWGMVFGTGTIEIDQNDLYKKLYEKKYRTEQIMDFINGLRRDSPFKKEGASSGYEDFDIYVRIKSTGTWARIAFTNDEKRKILEEIGQDKSVSDFVSHEIREANTNFGGQNLQLQAGYETLEIREGESRLQGMPGVVAPLPRTQEMLGPGFHETRDAFYVALGLPANIEQIIDEKYGAATLTGRTITNDEAAVAAAQISSNQVISGGYFSFDEKAAVERMLGYSPSQYQDYRVGTRIQEEEKLKMGSLEYMMFDVIKAGIFAGGSNSGVYAGGGNLYTPFLSSSIFFSFNPDGSPKQAIGFAGTGFQTKNWKYSALASTVKLEGEVQQYGATVSGQNNEKFAFVASGAFSPNPTQGRLEAGRASQIFSEMKAGLVEYSKPDLTKKQRVQLGIRLWDGFRLYQNWLPQDDLVRNVYGTFGVIAGTPKESITLTMSKISVLPGSDMFVSGMYSTDMTSFAVGTLVNPGEASNLPAERLEPKEIVAMARTKYSTGDFAFELHGYRLRDQSTIGQLATGGKISEKNVLGISMVGGFDDSRLKNQLKDFYKLDILVGNERQSIIIDLSAISDERAKGIAGQFPLSQAINGALRLWYLSGPFTSYKGEMEISGGSFNQPWVGGGTGRNPTFGFGGSNQTWMLILAYEKIEGVKGINGIVGMKYQTRF